MNVNEFLAGVNYALRGTDDDAPTVGTEEATYWLSTYNRKKDELYHDPRLRLSTAFYETPPNEPGTVATTGTTTLTGTDTYFTDYQVGDKITVSGETERTIATITSDTSLTVTVAFSNTASSKTFTRKAIIAASDQTYSVHRSFLYPSDQAYVVKTDGDRVYYDIIKPQERDRYNQQVYLSGQNPRLLTFTYSIASTDSIVGGTLYLPGFYLPADVSAATDLINVPDPEWGVMSTAAEVAFNDVVYEDKASDLNEKANALYRAMTGLDRAGTRKNSRNIPYNVQRLGQRTVR